MAKDKDEGKETKPSSKTKVAVKIQDDAVKVKEAEAKDVPALQPSKERVRVRFLGRQSLGPTLIAEHPVIRRKRGPSSNSASSSFHRRYHPCLLNCCQNKIVDLPFCLFFFLIAGIIHACSIAAKTRLWIYHSDELSLLQLVVKQACLGRFVFDVPFLYLIKKTAFFILFMSLSFLFDNYFMNGNVVIFPFDGT